ncbi:8676_t:CDS:2, partial [Funneliformis geosporum]
AICLSQATGILLLPFISRKLAFAKRRNAIEFPPRNQCWTNSCISSCLLWNNSSLTLVNFNAMSNANDGK